MSVRQHFNPASSYNLFKHKNPKCKFETYLARKDYEQFERLATKFTEKEFMEWSEYCTWANEFHQPTPNLRSWMNGCPRCSKEEMEHLTELKKKFMDDVKILAEKNQSETF